MTNFSYIMRFPETDHFYIGSTGNKERRETEHRADLRLGRHACLAAQEIYGLSPIVEFEWFPTETRQEAYALEQKLLDHYRHSPRLLNAIGVVVFRDDEVNRKISQSLQEHVVSEESRRKMGETKRGNTFWLGKTHSDESKDKMSQAHRGKQYALGHVVSQEVRQFLREKFTGSTHSEETRRLISETSPSQKTCKYRGKYLRQSHPSC